jgi:hypothetical protein
MYFEDGRCRIQGKEDKTELEFPPSQFSLH